MKVSGHGDQQLICPSSEEVGLLVDLCHAGASSDHLTRSAARKQRLNSICGVARVCCRLRAGILPTG